VSVRALVRLVVGGSLVACVAFAAAPAREARAATRRVPSDFATIQPAIDASSSGDTVAIDPGTYAERIALRSGVVVRAAGGAGSVTLDAQGQGACVSAAFVGAGTRLEGLRLTGGSGEDDGGARVGGALRVIGGLLDVVDCSFENSSASYGGGSAAQSASVTFTRCLWSGTSAPFGGGHFQAAGTARWVDALWQDVGAGAGAGVYATLGAQLTVDGGRIERAIASGDGGGFHVDSGVATISGVLFDGARALGQGGGIAIAAGGQVLVSHSAFVACESGQGGGAFFVSCDPAAPSRAAAGVDCALLDLTNVDILVCRGAAPAAGGVTDAATVRMRSSVVAGNASGLSCLDSRATLEVGCSLLYENGGTDLDGPCVPALDPSNRSEDPRLCDLPGRDLHACSNSPLLDPGCGDAYWGSQGEGCATCGPTPAAPQTWGRIKARYHR
jgi:hypothetical protein